MASFFGEIPKDLESYRKFHQASVDRRDEFWGQQARRLSWKEDFANVVSEDFIAGQASWFEGGSLNGCFNALDLQLQQGRGTHPALIYLDEACNLHSYSFQQLHQEVIRLSGALSRLKVPTGGRLVLYLPDCSESVCCMLACARLGIIYVPIPSWYPAEQVIEIVKHSQASALMTSNSTCQQDYLQKIASIEEAMPQLLRIVAGTKSSESARLYSHLIGGSPVSDSESCVAVKAEHPLFIHYSNAITGIPRGTVLPTGGFLVQARSSHSTIFHLDDPRGEPERLYCGLNLATSAAQCYGLWGCLLRGDCLVLSQDRAAPVELLFSKTAPTQALVTPTLLGSWLKQVEEDPLKTKHRLGLIASCQDVLTPNLAEQSRIHFGTGVNPVLNLWIQNETGAALVGNLPAEGLNRPGSLGLALPGIEAQVFNELGESCRLNEAGQLVFGISWPAMIRDIWQQRERFFELYFSRVPGKFSTYDGVRMDADGFFWFMGRRDDSVKVQGVSLRTAEIETVLLTHPSVTDSTVVGISHVSGDTLCAFVALKESELSQSRSSLTAELSSILKKRIGEFAVPSHWVLVRELPRTKTGKVARRILRRIASGDIDAGEDLSHVANPGSVSEIIQTIKR